MSAKIIYLNFKLSEKKEIVDNKNKDKKENRFSDNDIKIFRSILDKASKLNW